MRNIFSLLTIILLAQSGFAQTTTPAAPDISGFKLIDIQPGSLYEKLGLKQGDVIKSCNGKPVVTVEDAMALYNKLKTANKVDLEFIRDGQVKKLQYKIK